MNILNKKLTSTNALLSKLEQRISSLESGFDLFTKRIQEESNSRLELAKSSQVNHSANAFQIQTLKERMDILSKSTNEAISQFKYNLTKDFSERTSHLQNLQSTIFDTLDKKAQNTHDIQCKLNTVENDILSMIKKLSEDLSKNSAQIDFLEKRQNEHFNTTKEQMKDINEKIIQFQYEINALNKFKENSNENFAGMARDIIHQQEILDEFITKISDQIGNYELINEKNNTKINDEINNMIKMQEDIYADIETINAKTINEINKFIEDISTEVKNNKDEMALLEKHITEEQKNFGNFIQEKMGNYENSINKNLEYCDEDIKTLRKDVDLLKYNFNDFKEKTFEAVNDVEKYQNKKYDDLFRILSGNNLIKSNFRYNNKIGTERENNIEYNEKNNNNIIIQEQNYNIGLSKDN